MKIFVCLKQVPDTESRIQVKADRSGIEESGLKWVMNPYDEYAVEEALKLKEAKGAGGSVTVVSVGPKSRVSEALRTAMAMGADDGIMIDTPVPLDSYWTAKALARRFKKRAHAIWFSRANWPSTTMRRAFRKFWLNFSTFHTSPWSQK